MPLFPKTLYGARPYEGPCTTCGLYGCTCGMYTRPFFVASPAAPGSEWRCCELSGDAKRLAPATRWRWEQPADFMEPRLRKWLAPRKRLWKRLRRLVRRARALYAVRFNHERVLWEGAASLQLRRLADLRRSQRMRELAEKAQTHAQRVTWLHEQARGEYERAFGRAP